VKRRKTGLNNKNKKKKRKKNKPKTKNENENENTLKHFLLTFVAITEYLFSILGVAAAAAAAIVSRSSSSCWISRKDFWAGPPTFHGVGDVEDSSACLAASCLWASCNLRSCWRNAACSASRLLSISCISFSDGGWLFQGSAGFAHGPSCAFLLASASVAC